MINNEIVQRSFLAEFDVHRAERVIEGRAVPYGHAEEVSDDGVTSYLEEWSMGAFQRACQPANAGRVKLNYTHDDTVLRNWIGKTLRLDERADGLYGAWRVDDTDLGDIALYKARDGQLPGLSVAARIVDQVTRDRVIVRTRALLDHVALVEEPAFSGALVTAVRHRVAPGAADDWASRVAEMRRRVTR